MSKKRYIDTRFWDDSYIINIDPIEKLLFLYLLTNPLTNIVGIYEISIKRIAFDTGIDKEMVLKLLNRLEKDKRAVYFEGWIIIKNFIKNQSKNPSVEKGMLRELSSLPDNILIQAIDRLSEAGTYLTLLNLTIPNLTKPNLTEKEKSDLLKKIKEHNFIKSI